VLAAST
jgi:hypothetical protein